MSTGELASILSLLHEAEQHEENSANDTSSSSSSSAVLLLLTAYIKEHLSAASSAALEPFLKLIANKHRQMMASNHTGEASGGGVEMQDSYNLTSNYDYNNLTALYYYDNVTYDGGCSSRSYAYNDLTQNDVARRCFIGVYIVVMVLSVIGNLMVMYTVWRNKHMRNTTNYYIVNLAVCDFFVASFVMPLKLLEYTAPCSWQVFGQTALCSIVSYILPTFVFASVLTLVATSIERYQRIVNPLRSLNLSRSRSRQRCILLFAWLVPMCLSAPYLFSESYAFNIHGQHGSVSRQICNDRFDDIDKIMYSGSEHSAGRFRKAFFFFLFFTIYLVPLLVILITCAKMAKCLLQPIRINEKEASSSSNAMRMTRRREESKRRVAKMVITVAISFIVCWSPFYWVTLVSQLQQHSFLRQSNFLFTMLSTHLIGFINSAVNPLIYHIMNEKFRKSFKNIFHQLFCCLLPLLRRRRDNSWSNRGDVAGGHTPAPFCGYVGSTSNSNETPLKGDYAKVNNFRTSHRHSRPRNHFTERAKYNAEGNIVRNQYNPSIPLNSLSKKVIGSDNLDLIIHNSTPSSSSSNQCPCKDYAAAARIGLPTGYSHIQHHSNGAKHDLDDNPLKVAISSPRRECPGLSTGVMRQCVLQMDRQSTSHRLLPAVVTAPVMKDPATSHTTHIHGPAEPSAGGPVKRAVSAPSLVCVSIMLHNDSARYFVKRLPIERTGKKQNSDQQDMCRIIANCSDRMEETFDHNNIYHDQDQTSSVDVNATFRSTRTSPLVVEDKRNRPCSLQNSEISQKMHDRTNTETRQEFVDKDVSRNTTRDTMNVLDDKEDVTNNASQNADIVQILAPYIGCVQDTCLNTDTMHGISDVTSDPQTDEMLAQDSADSGISGGTPP